MAVLITDTCINCGACIDECPVEAIVDDEIQQEKRSIMSTLINVLSV